LQLVPLGFHLFPSRSDFSHYSYFFGSKWRLWGAAGTRRSLQLVPLGFHPPLFPSPSDFSHYSYFFGSKWRPWGAAGTRHSLQLVPLGFHPPFLQKYLPSMAALGGVWNCLEEQLTACPAWSSFYHLLIPDGNPGGLLELTVQFAQVPLGFHLMFTFDTKYLVHVYIVFIGVSGGLSWTMAPAEGSSAESSIPRVKKIPG
jgi:hypothetical protein